MRKLINIFMSYFATIHGSKERGATMVEYAILVALISVAAIAIIAILGGQIQDAFDAVQTEIANNLP